MKNLLTKKMQLFKTLVMGVLVVCGFLFSAVIAHAAVLDPAVPVTTCGELAVAGTYTLTTNVGTASQTCFTVTSPNVVLTSTATTTINGNISNVGYPITLQGYVVNHGTISGNALLKENSSNTGTISGNVEVFYPSTHPIGGTVSGFVGYHGYPATFNRGLVAEYLFNNGTELTDTSGNGYDLTNNNGVTISNSYATFNGSNYLSRDDAPFPHGSGARTIIAKVRIPSNANSGNNSIVSWGDNSPNGGSMMDLDYYGNNTFRLVERAAWSDYEYPISFSTQQWGYMGFSSDGTYGQMYVNGSPVGNNFALNFNTQYSGQFFIGQKVSDLAWPMRGDIDTVRVWNRALSSSEMSQLMSSSVDSSLIYNTKLYFNGSSDSDWANISNWYQDANFTIPALALPIGGDTIYISSNITNATEVTPVASSTTFTDATLGSGVTLTSDSVTFQGVSENQGIINGAVTFLGTSTNSGTINGNVVLKGGSINSGTINGNADVYSPAPNPIGGTVTGTVTYHNYPGTKYFDDQASGTYDCNWDNANNWWLDADHTIPAGDIPTDQDVVYIAGQGICNASNNSVTVKAITFTGNAGWDMNWNWMQLHATDYIYFKDYSYMEYGYTYDPVSFYDYSGNYEGNIYNTGYFIGDNTYNTYGYIQDPIFLPVANGNIWTNAANDNDWNNPANWSTGAVPVNGDNILLQASATLPGDITNDVYFIDNSITLNGAGHTINGNVLASKGADVTLSNATVTGNVTAGNGNSFADNSWMWSTAGTGGNTTLTNVIVGGSISAGSGGNAGCYSTSNGGSGGSVIITTTNLDIRGRTISAGAGGSSDTCYGGYIGGTVGTVTLNYSTLSTDNSTYIYNAFNLIVNGASSGAWNGVFNPQIFYFDDKNNIGTGAEGDWGTVTNWWTDPAETTQATRIPYAFEDVFINAGNITKDSSGTAGAKSVTFNGTSTNGIGIDSKNFTYKDLSANNWNGLYSLPSTFGNGLIGYWKLDETTNGTAPGGADFLDSSGLGNNGTTNGYISYGVSGISGSTAADFNGSGYVDTPMSNLTISSTASWTMSGWIKENSTYSSGSGYVDNRVIAARSTQDCGNGTTEAFIGFDNSNHISAGTGKSCNSSTAVSSDVSANPGQWYYVVATYADGQVNIYVDGVYKGSTAFDGQFSSAIPSDFWRLGESPFTGSLQDVAIWNRAISSSEIAQIYNAQRPHNSINGLVGYWKLDSNADDSSGSGNNGVVTGSLTYGVSGPNNTKAAGFDGNTYVDVGNPSSLQLQYFTALAWVKYTNTTGFVFSHSSNGGSGWGINIDNNGIGFDDAFAYQVLSYSTHINDGNWHQVGIYRKTNNDVGLIIDGQVVATGNYGNSFAFGNFNIGARDGYNNPYGTPFNGSISEVSVWNRALSSSEISQVYQSGVESFMPSNIFTNDLSNNNGSTTGMLTRLFTTAASTTRNFLTEGGRSDWIVIAQGVVVDLTHAIYDTAKNTFKALLGGRFITGGENPSVAPYITIASPLDRNLVGNTVKWQPQINWDTDNTGITAHCYYRMDGSGDDGYTEVNCANNGSEIPRPTAGAHTLYLRATNSNVIPGLAETSVNFTYDNVSPAPTSCGSDILDESTRQYYYLEGDVTGDCHATVNTTLKGAIASTTVGYTVHGNVIADGLNSNGHNISLENITVTGTVSSNGNGLGNRGGNISLDTYTNVATVTANGAQSGNGGNITISGDVIDLTNKSLYANEGSGSPRGTAGTLTVNYITSVIADATTVHGPFASIVFNPGSTYTAVLSTDLFNGATIVRVPRTLYFNNASSTSWSNLSNWWNNSGHTSVAEAIPLSGDTVFVDGSVSAASSSPVSLANITAGQYSGNSAYTINLTNISGNVTFNGNVANTGTTTGNAIFNNTSHNASTGSVTGTAIFNNSSYNQGKIAGNTEFHNTSNNTGGTVNPGACSFFDSAHNGGTCTGGASYHTPFYYLNSTGDGKWNTLNNWWTGASSTGDHVFPGRSDTVYIGATITEGPSATTSFSSIYVASSTTGGGNFSVNFTGAYGPAYFYASSTNAGVVNGDFHVYGNRSISSVNLGSFTGDAYFHNGSWNDVTVGNAFFYDTAYNASNGTVSGNAVFNGTNRNDGTIVGFATVNTGATLSGSGTVQNETVNQGNIASGTFSSQVTNSGNGGVVGAVTNLVSMIFNGASHIASTGSLSGDAQFNDSAYNQGTVTGDSIFSGLSFNIGTTSNATFVGDLAENFYQASVGLVTGTKTRLFTTLAPQTNLLRNFTDSAWTVVADNTIVKLLYRNLVDLFGRNTNTTTTLVTQGSGFILRPLAPGVITSCGVLDTANATYILGTSTQARANFTNYKYDTCFVVRANGITIDGKGATVSGLATSSSLYAIVATSTYAQDGTRNAFTNLTVKNIKFKNFMHGLLARGDDFTTGVGGNGASTTLIRAILEDVNVSGGDPTEKGGDAGTINFLSSTSTALIADGGNTSTCGGIGGNGGNIYISTDSSVATSSNNGGNSITCPNNTSSHGASGYQGQVAPAAPEPSESAAPVVTPIPSVTPSPVAQGSTAIQAPGLINIAKVLPPVLSLNPVKFVTLPSFGTGDNNFSFISLLTNFFEAPLPAELTTKLAVSPKLTTYLNTAGLKTAQDLVNLKKKPLILPETKETIPGLFTITTPVLPVRLPNGEFSNSEASVKTLLTTTDLKNLVQKIAVNPGTHFTIHLVPTTNSTTLTFNGRNYTLVNNSIALVAPRAPGIYKITSASSPLTVIVEVMAPKTPEIITVTENTTQSIFTKVTTWISRVFSFWKR